MTIYDIAKMAGVSASTVSRVINHKPGINEETRKKVEKLLAEHDFSLNETARGLSVQSTKLIGILMEDIRLSHHTDAAYMMERELKQKGYICLMLSTGIRAEEKAECIRILEQRRVDGVILVGSMFGEKLVEESIRVHLPAVPVIMVNGFLPLPNVFGILADEETGVKEETALLLELGRKHLLFAADTRSESNARKQKGFTEALLLAGLSPEKIRVSQEQNEDLSPDMTMERGCRITKEFMEQHPETDGIIYSCDLLAVGGIHALKEMGRRVPEDVAVLGIDNTIYGRICRPSLTTLDNRLVEISKLATEILLKVLCGETAMNRLSVYTEIIERDSTPKRQ